MNKLGKGHGGWATVCLVVLLSVLVVRPSGVQAFHAPATGDDSVCSACHTLDATEGDANTSYISSSARTFPQLKANDGLPNTSTPAYLGCTFCHFVNANTAMKPALGHFQGRLSFHPVGYDFRNHLSTGQLYVSSYLSNKNNELDCVDCHDIDLGKLGPAPTGYPDHSNRPVGNPYLLRNVTVVGEYDGLCRTCHRSDAPVTVKTVSMQLTKHADGAFGRPIVEDDGTVLRTNDLNQDGIPDPAGIVDQCRVCHDTHYSTKYRLFNDGKEKHKVGAAEVADAEILGDGNNCTTVCHYPGDNNNLGAGGNFGKYGHGKAESTYKYQNFVPNAAGNYITMGMNCTSCHVSLDIGTKTHVEPAIPSGTNDREKYKNRFSLNISLQVGDTMGSAYGNPITGVCAQCHSGYDKHVGQGFNVGCQDCHDEHAEGSGTTSNVFMIPQKSKVEGTYMPFGSGAHTKTKVGTEVVTYDSPRFNLLSTPYAADVGNEDFYRPGAVDTGDGVCDVQECHGAGRRLNIIMPGTHSLADKSGAVQIPGADCESCHQHNGDPGGGWRATASCGECHSYPGINPVNSDHLLSPVHDRHVAAIPAGYGFPCEACHFNNTHNTSLYVNNVTVWSNISVPPASINIRFDPARNAGTNLTYGGGDADVGTGGIATHDGSCVGLYCHGNNTTSQVLAGTGADWIGTNETPNWGTAGALACNACHAAIPATPSLTGAHADHVTTAGYACADCHGPNPSAVAVSTHVNNQVSLLGLTYSTGLVVGDNSFGTCSTGSCHNATTNVGWNTVATDCNSCHVNTADVNNFVGNDKLASMVNSTEYAQAGSGGHGKVTTGSKTCATSSCHVMSAGHDFSAALGGANPYRLFDQVAGGSLDFSCSYTTGCHPAATLAPATGLAYGTFVSHTTQAMASSGYATKRTWPAWRPRCTECHDPHGDGANLSMVQRELYDKGSSVQGVNTGTEDWGVHATPENSAMTFTDNTTGQAASLTSYANSAAPFSNLCQECHEAANIIAFKDGASASVLPHTATSDCSVCHKHDTAFKPSGCTACHGNTVGGNFWPDSAAEHGVNYPNRLGDHATHINAIAFARWGAGATMLQKNSTCDTCHPGTAGAGGHDTNTGGSLASAADVHGDPANAATRFQNIAGVANAVANTYDNTVGVNGKDCSNVDCHYRVTSPTSGVATVNGDGWYQPTLIASVNCASCHGNGVAGAALPNSHPVHVNAANKAFGCWYCHPSGVNNASYTVAHQTGIANISFLTTIDPATGGPRAELYAGLATPTRPVSYGAGPFATCTVTYCHGNFLNGKTLNAPTWGLTASGDCGSCHDADGTVAPYLTVIASGNHTDHLTAAWGPLFGTTGCAGTTTGCHTAALVTTATHVDGSVQFDNIAAAPPASTLGATATIVPTTTDTDRCSYCHMTTSMTVNIAGPATVTNSGTVLAKTNWSAGGYKLPCLTCHSGLGASMLADNSGAVRAANELGDDSGYGAEIRGHNRSLAQGPYTDAAAVTTNPPAAKLCETCHDALSTHINGVNDTTYAGQRLLATINGVATASSFNTACYACHATGGTTPASSLVSTHGNTNAAFIAPAKDANAEAFAYNCNACHNVHGNTNGTGYNNIYMIKPTIGVGNSFTSAPGGADVTTIANIRFERVSGVDSMDDGATTADNVCLTCHINANRPGSGTAMRTIGGDHTGNAGGYVSNDVGKNCASCHVHNYDAVQVATPDGFMPQQCNACHSFPGLSTVGAEKILSGVHNIHVNPINDAVPGYAIPCTVCHYLYNHNQSNFVDGGVWNDTNVPIATINVQFDPARNAGVNLTYAGGDADVGTGASATHNGVCANLYCHGDNTTSQTDWVGPGAPAWGAADPARLACTACHADVPATGAHTLHANSTGALDRSDCNLCHTNVQLIDAATPMVMAHADGTTNVLLTWTGATGPLFVNGYCSANTCHSSSATDGLWNDPVLNCDACHYFNTAGNPSDVTNTTGTTFKPISEASHDGHFASTGKVWSCNDCHPDNIGDTTGQASLTIGLVHITTGAGTDAVILTNKAIAVVDNALISTTQVAQWWNAPADWVDAANTCANKCHNPAAGAYLSTAWGTTAASCSFCHAIASPGPATGSHAAHMNATATYGQVIACVSCHPDWQTVPNYGHMSGAVQLTPLAGLTYGGTGNLNIPYGAPFGTCLTTTCHNDGKSVSPVAVLTSTWGTPIAEPSCAICHALTPTTNYHTDHISAAWGPNMGTNCGLCHTANANNTSMSLKPTHIDAKVDFANLVTTTSVNSVLGATAPGGAPDSTSTDRCNNCHLITSVTVNIAGPTTVSNSGTVLAKTNWNVGGYKLPCLTCHSGTGATINADGSGAVKAANELGDDSGYGAEIRGHNRSLAQGPYTDAAAVTTNPAAAKLCEGCHDAVAAHINGVNDTTYAGQRLMATINGVAAITTVTGACYACHATGGTTPALSLVSTHGNTNAAFIAPAKDANAEAFAYKCEACHNVHGNTNGSGYNNIYMIKPTIGVGNSFTTAPGGADVTTIANIRFERVSGVDSMDDGATTADNVCLTCHNNANRPGSGTAMRTIGGDHTGNAGGYVSNDVGKNCASCHVHNYDAVQVATPDGFMPQQCNACHSFPGLSTVGAEKILSGVHNIHVNPINDAVPGYAIPCTVCHYLYNHNQSNFVDGGVWNDTNVPVANINVRFDSARNAGVNLTYAGGDADVGTTANAGHNGVCANLYCHGDNTTSQTDWVGPGAPAWGAADPARLACTGCHADVPATGAHTLHANSTGATDRSDCNLCHTNVQLIDAATPMVMAHADGTTNVLLTWTGATAPLFVDGYCSANTCHSSAAADGRWNDPVLNCDACHYFNVAGNPSAVTNTAGSTFKAISEASHDGHFASTGKVWSCNDCHPDNIGDTTGQASLTIGLVHLTVGAGTDAVILQNKAIPVVDNALISTTQVAQWWNAPADWVDAANTCANKCHNPAAGAYLSTAWGTTAASCSFCHAIASPGPATGSHAAHMNAAGTYGQVIACVSCHPDWQTVPNYGHMSGTVNLTNMTGLVYSGTVAIPYGAPFGACTTTTCHQNGKGSAVASSTWGTPIAEPSCAICHLNPNTTGNDGARHVNHDTSVWVPNACGSCHAAPSNKTSMSTYATHINGVVNMGGTATVAYSAPTCTNSCHLVNAATGDWLDVALLACTDCHTATYIGTAPASGLHGPMTNVMAHDVQFKLTPVEVLPGTATCTHCHTAAGPSSTHVTGPYLAAPQTSVQTTYSWVAANVTTYVQATGCQATCHTDYKLADTAGLWRRKWMSVTDAVPGASNNPGDAVCDNCHGDFTGWRLNEANASTTDHSNPSALNPSGDAMGVVPDHIDCQNCHGWGHASYNKVWGGAAPAHGDGFITMNGPQPTTGAGYIDGGTDQGGCAKACHVSTWVMNTNSGWTANYGDFGGGSCESCHNGVQSAYPLAPNVMGPGTSATGTGGTPKPYDDGTWGFNVTGHGANGTAFTKVDTDDRPAVTTYLASNAACTDCHTLQSHHNNGVLNSGAGARQINTYHLRTDGTYPFVPASAVNDYDVQIAFDNACFNRCHAAAGSYDMRHLGALEPVYGMAKFGGGTSGSIPDGEVLAWPIDSDVSTRTSTANPDYMPCVTCHNAHGTNVVRLGFPGHNLMLRMTNTPATPFCTTCHP